MGVEHVIPVNDLIEHLTPEDCFYECPCSPDVEVVAGGGFVVTHHSLDGRERQESGSQARGPWYAFSRMANGWMIWLHEPIVGELAIMASPSKFCHTFWGAWFGTRLRNWALARDGR